MSNKTSQKESIKFQTILFRNDKSESSFLKTESTSYGHRTKNIYLKTDKSTTTVPSQSLTNRFQSNDSKNFTKTTLNSQKGKNLLIKYKPKHLVNLKKIEIPLPSLGKSTISCEKLFGKINNKTINKVGSDFETIYKNRNLINDMEFRNSYIIKYSNVSESFKKFLSYKELITENQKKTFEYLFNDILKFFDKQSHILFNSNNNIPSIYSYKDSRCNTDINPSISDANCNLNNNKIITNCHEYNLMIIKIFNLLFKELKNCRDIIANYKKVDFEQKRKLNSLTKKYTELLSNSECISKANNNKSIEVINQEKIDLSTKENEYKLQIFNLETQIINLTKLLQFNKIYYDKYFETLNKYEQNKIYTEELKNDLNKELREKNTECLIEKDKQDELISKFTDLENIIQELRREKEKQKFVNIETLTKISKLTMEISEKNESLRMMNEELEYFFNEYNKEKHNHNNTTEALRNLENKIYIESKDRMERERIEKERLMKEKIQNEKLLKEKKDGRVRKGTVRFKNKADK